MLVLTYLSLAVPSLQRDPRHNHHRQGGSRHHYLSNV